MALMCGGRRVSCGLAAPVVVVGRILLMGKMLHVVTWDVGVAVVAVVARRAS